MLILLTIHYPCYYFSSPGSFLVLLSPDPRHGRCGEQAFRLRQGQGGQAVGNVFFFGASDPTIKDTLSWCHDVYCENSWKLRMTWAFWGGSDPTFRRLFHCDRCHPRPRPASFACKRATATDALPRALTTTSAWALDWANPSVAAETGPAFKVVLRVNSNFYRLYGRSIHSSQAYKPRKIPGGDLVDISAQNQHLFSKKKESHRTLV